MSAIGQVDLIVSSPQVRALESATIISEGMGIGPVAIVDELKERCAGDWSGLTVDEIEAKYPRWLAGGRRPPGFEPADTLEGRVLGALHSMAKEFPEASILVVCHGGVIRSVEDTFSVSDGRVPNLGGRVLHADATNWSMGERLVLAPKTITGGTPNLGRL